MIALSEMNTIIDTCISEDENTHVSYIEPAYPNLLSTIGYTIIDSSEDIYFESSKILLRHELAEFLDLCVKKKNASTSKVGYIMSWIYDIMKPTIDANITDTENELMKNMIEYMKLTKEQKSEENKIESITKGMNFSKATP